MEKIQKFQELKAQNATIAFIVMGIQSAKKSAKQAFCVYFVQEC